MRLVVQCFFGTQRNLVARTLNLRLDGREFNSRQPRLILDGWPSSGRQSDKPPQYSTEPHRPTQPPTLSRTGNEYRPKCGDAVRLRSKGRSHSVWINVWVAGKTVWTLVKTCQPQRFRNEYRTHYKALYKCSVYLPIPVCIIYLKTLQLQPFQRYKRNK